MRKNFPVTQNEYVLKEGQTIVSKTDLKGIITYVNQDFIDVSGYAAEELLGKPHNLVRHPDMPPVAFDDLWRTLKAGKSWTGVVKNRSKNGDSYWVEASVAPILEHGKVTGYASIRCKPGRAQVAAAEQAYRQVRAGDSNLAVREGAVIQHSLLRHLDWIRGCSLKLKLRVFSSLMTVLFGTALASAIEHDKTLIAVLSALGVLMSLTGWFTLHRAAVAPLEQMRRDLDQMSAGDLTGRIAAGGSAEAVQVLQALRILQINVKLLVGQIKEASTVVSRGAADIAGSNADLASRSEAQAGSLEQTAASMEELTGTVQQNAGNARDAHSLVTAAAQVAADGGTAVRQVVETMSSIRSSSGKIVDIIGVIDGLAFQTNILALNAAVEAARAGEQGRGFAVVAAEVRNLAQRSATAAKEVKQLILSSVNDVEYGGELVAEAGRLMETIVQSVASVATRISEISAASQEQSVGIEHVNQAITHLGAIAQHNAGVVDHAAAAASDMQQQAHKLDRLVNTFKLVGSAPAPVRVLDGATGTKRQMQPNSQPNPQPGAQDGRRSQAARLTLARSR